MCPGDISEKGLPANADEHAVLIQPRPGFWLRAGRGLLSSRQPPPLPLMESSLYVERAAGLGWRRHPRYRVREGQRNGGVTHKIDPAVDGERDYISETLGRTGKIKSMNYHLPPNPLYEARNATGAPYRSDGRLLVIFLSIDVWSSKR